MNKETKETKEKKGTMKKNVLFIFGGASPEHEISLRSIKSILKALNRDRWFPVLAGISQQGTWFHFSEEELSPLTSIDENNQAHKAWTLCLHQGKTYFQSQDGTSKTPVELAFPIVHGPNGEDGGLQGLLQLNALPYVGSKVCGSALAMDKILTKKLLSFHDIPVVPFVSFDKKNIPTYPQVTQQLGSPFILKPANMGSSIGVHKIDKEGDYQSRLADSFQYDKKLLAESFITGRELECAVLEEKGEFKASTLGEIQVTDNPFYSYEAKYLHEKSSHFLRIPAELPEGQIKELQTLALQTARVLECRSMARVDFFLQDEDFFVNEVNTLPGFTSISMYPKLWETSGCLYPQLLDILLSEASL